jgi:hypothetical protein
MTAKRKRTTAGPRKPRTQRAAQKKPAPKPIAPPAPPALSGFGRHRSRAIELFQRLRAWLLRNDKDGYKQDMKNLRAELRDVKQRSSTVRAVKARRK